MSDMKTISIAEDFSRYPSGRDAKDGDYSGEKFLNDHLKPKMLEAIRTEQKLVVSLDGLMSCGSSFLDASFGELARSKDVGKKVVRRTLVIKHSSPMMERIKRSIDRCIERA